MDRKQKQKVEGEKLISRGEMRSLVLALQAGQEKFDALMRLCPCRNCVYDREVWKRIFVARESDDFKIRQEAKHAIQTQQLISYTHLFFLSGVSDLMIMIYHGGTNEASDKFPP